MTSLSKLSTCQIKISTQTSHVIYQINWYLFICLFIYLFILDLEKSEKQVNIKKSLKGRTLFI